MKSPKLPLASAILAAAFLSTACSTLQLGRHAAESVLRDDDPDLVEEAIPTLIKAAETAADTWPADRGCAEAAAALQLLYAGAFLSERVERLPPDDFTGREALAARIKGLYRRAFARARATLELREPGFFDKLAAGDVEALQRRRAVDAPLLYYAAAATLGAYSMDPFDASHAKYVQSAILCLERIRAIVPGWNDGSAEELLMSIAFAVPCPGDPAEKAERLYREALAASGGKRASIHVGWALSVAVPGDDPQAFRNALGAALSVDTDADTDLRLLNLLAQRKARRLLGEMDRYFLDPLAGSPAE
ncbi:MAG: TRAP transporter TatT component family protein [Spirochaetes bacterium]|nr:TRAP transporter TatT component family protein [Spirochaetota bacterium]